MIKAAREKHPPVYSLSVDGVIDAYLAKRLSLYLSIDNVCAEFVSQAKVECVHVRNKGARE